jgi:hypothetical protein
VTRETSGHEPRDNSGNEEGVFLNAESSVTLRLARLRLCGLESTAGYVCLCRTYLTLKPAMIEAERSSRAREPDSAPVTQPGPAPTLR